MSTRLNLSDAINMAFNTGKDPTFEYEDTTYTFSPEGIVDWLSSLGFGPNVPSEVLGDTVNIESTSGNISISPNGLLIISGLPTSDPLVDNAIWLDGGVLTISAGEQE